MVPVGDPHGVPVGEPVGVADPEPDGAGLTLGERLPDPEPELEPPGDDPPPGVGLRCEPPPGAALPGLPDPLAAGFGFGGRLVTGGRTFVTSPTTGSRLSSTDEAPLR